MKHTFRSQFRATWMLRHVSATWPNRQPPILTAQSKPGTRARSSAKNLDGSLLWCTLHAG
eukprot:364341-Chlamydomonas_euryale.AAC.24